TNRKSNTAIQPQGAISMDPDAHNVLDAGGRKTKEAEARARMAPKKRDWHDALDKSSSRRAIKKKPKADPKTNAIVVSRSHPLSSRWDLVVEGEAKATTGHRLSAAPTRTPSSPQPAKKPRRKGPPQRLNLQDSHRVA